MDSLVITRSGDTGKIMQNYFMLETIGNGGHLSLNLDRSREVGLWEITHYQELETAGVGIFAAYLYLCAKPANGWLEE